MMKIPVIAIFDIGKTNKKLFLFNEDYLIVYEKTVRINETMDEDGDACEDLEALRLFIFEGLDEILDREEFLVKAINISAYGASLVYLDKNLKPLTLLYNYLKPYPRVLKEQFYREYGGMNKLSLETASPALGSLNVGLQLYRLKYQHPAIFSQVKVALHLPQYISFLISEKCCTDITSIGCHTQLWELQKNNYHNWVYKENMYEKLAPLYSCHEINQTSYKGHKLNIGIGMHDSSAALIPYLINYNVPFVLLSTGTWCISMNPFNETLLTNYELENDCLCYLSYKGKAVKSSRLFMGFEHEQQVNRIAKHFSVDPGIFDKMEFSTDIINKIRSRKKSITPPNNTINIRKHSLFLTREMSDFSDPVEAYHQLISDLVDLQQASTQLIIKGSDIKRIYVDGGFSKNSIFMNLLADAFPNLDVYVARVAQASALGAAAVIHKYWNSKSTIKNLIKLKFYPANKSLLFVI